MDADGEVWGLEKMKAQIKEVHDQGGVVKRAKRMALCRCGASENKPFCDGAHAAIGFSDGGLTDSHPGSE